MGASVLGVGAVALDGRGVGAYIAGKTTKRWNEITKGLYGKECAERIALLIY